MVRSGTRTREKSVRMDLSLHVLIVMSVVVHGQRWGYEGYGGYGGYGRYAGYGSRRVVRHNNWVRNIVTNTRNTS